MLANGPVTAKDIEKEARAACLLSEDQLIGQSKPFRSARQALAISSCQPTGQKAGGWWWALPGHQMPSEASDAPQKGHLTGWEAPDAACIGPGGDGVSPESLSCGFFPPWTEMRLSHGRPSLYIRADGRRFTCRKKANGKRKKI